MFVLKPIRMVFIALACVALGLHSMCWIHGQLNDSWTDSNGKAAPARESLIQWYILQNDSMDAPIVRPKPAHMTEEEYDALNELESTCLPGIGSWRITVYNDAEVAFPIDETEREQEDLD